VIVLDSDAYADSVKIYHKLNGGRLYDKILINKMPKNHDVSSFNQTYGNQELKQWLQKKNIRIND
jgi:hypothetical protein